jgi:hypothetical protein|tara:strand:+ start:4840 stop:4980 length:141 start_codon:yes stop_codon:yes gene_type:complete
METEEDQISDSSLGKLIENTQYQVDQGGYWWYKFEDALTALKELQQ